CALVVPPQDTADKQKHPRPAKGRGREPAVPPFLTSMRTCESLLAHSARTPPEGRDAAPCDNGGLPGRLAAAKRRGWVRRRLRGRTLTVSPALCARCARVLVPQECDM